MIPSGKATEMDRGPLKCPLTVNAIMVEADAHAHEAGFRDSTHTATFGEHIALCHSELSEALEAFRKDGMVSMRFTDSGKPEGVGEELADVIIRVCDMAMLFNIPLEDCIRHKMLYNRTRPKHHGGKSI